MVTCGGVWSPGVVCGHLGWCVVTWGGVWSPGVVCGHLGWCVITLGGVWSPGAVCDLLLMAEHLFTIDHIIFWLITMPLGDHPHKVDHSSVIDHMGGGYLDGDHLANLELT